MLTEAASDTVRHQAAHSTRHVDHASAEEHIKSCASSPAPTASILPPIRHTPYTTQCTPSTSPATAAPIYIHNAYLYEKFLDSCDWSERLARQRAQRVKELQALHKPPAADTALSNVSSQEHTPPTLLHTDSAVKAQGNKTSAEKYHARHDQARLAERQDWHRFAQRQVRFFTRHAQLLHELRQREAVTAQEAERVRAQVYHAWEQDVFLPTQREVRAAAAAAAASKANTKATGAKEMTAMPNSRRPVAVGHLTRRCLCNVKTDKQRHDAHGSNAAAVCDDDLDKHTMHATQRGNRASAHEQVAKDTHSTLEESLWRAYDKLYRHACVPHTSHEMYADIALYQSTRASPANNGPADDTNGSRCGHTRYDERSRQYALPPSSPLRMGASVVEKERAVAQRLMDDYVTLAMYYAQSSACSRSGVMGSLSYFSSSSPSTRDDCSPSTRASVTCCTSATRRLPRAQGPCLNGTLPHTGQTHAHGLGCRNSADAGEVLATLVNKNMPRESALPYTRLPLSLLGRIRNATDNIDNYTYNADHSNNYDDNSNSNNNDNTTGLSRSRNGADTTMTSETKAQETMPMPAMLAMTSVPRPHHTMAMVAAMHIPDPLNTFCLPSSHAWSAAVRTGVGEEMIGKERRKGREPESRRMGAAPTREATLPVTHWSAGMLRDTMYGYENRHVHRRCGGGAMKREEGGW